MEARRVTEYQRLFLVQARADFSVFEWLRKQSDFPACHALHYLQMATEMLGKAYAWKQGPRASTHRAFAGFLRSLPTNRQAQKQLGYERKNASWLHQVRKSVPLAERVEDLAPAPSPDSPNPEYAWPRESPQRAPAEYDFPIWEELERSPSGRQFLSLTARLFAVADAFL